MHGAEMTTMLLGRAVAEVGVALMREVARGARHALEVLLETVERPGAASGDVASFLALDRSESAASGPTRPAFAGSRPIAATQSPAPTLGV